MGLFLSVDGPFLMYGSGQFSKIVAANPRTDEAEVTPPYGNSDTWLSEKKLQFEY